MGWGEAQDKETDTSWKNKFVVWYTPEELEQIEEAHRMLDELGVLPGPLAARVLRVQTIVSSLQTELYKTMLLNDAPTKEEQLDFRSYLRNELRKEFERALASYPWWCPICGAGGNYEGERPDQYWLPPEGHKCEEVINDRTERPSEGSDTTPGVREGVVGWSRKWKECDRPGILRKEGITEEHLRNHDGKEKGQP